MKYLIDRTQIQKIAGKLGITEQYFYRILGGKRPSMGLALEIEKTFGIPVSIVATGSPDQIQQAFQQAA